MHDIVCVDYKDEIPVQYMLHIASIPQTQVKITHISVEQKIFDGENSSAFCRLEQGHKIFKYNLHAVIVYMIYNIC